MIAFCAFRPISGKNIYFNKFIFNFEKYKNFSAFCLCFLEREFFFSNTKVKVNLEKLIILIWYYSSKTKKNPFPARPRKYIKEFKYIFKIKNLFWY